MSSILKKEDIKYLVVHESDWPENWWWADDRAAGFTPEETDTELIHWYHNGILGWQGIGYHYVIELDGGLRAGRPEYWKGAHVREHNHEALGIVLVGHGEYTERQLQTLKYACFRFLHKYPEREILGHRDLDSKKTCPGFDVKEWWNNARMESVL